MGRDSLSPRASLGLAAIAVALACATGSAAAAENAAATITSQQLSATSWQYSITLDDTGTTPLGTLWFAWVPGEDFMPTAPSGIDSPTGWTAKVTHAGAADGYAIQWKAATPASLLAPGQSLSGFTFESATSPEAMMGDSPFFPGVPVTTTFVYQSAPFSDAGVKFEVSSVPEPSSLALMGLGALAFAFKATRRRGTTAA